MVQDTNCVPLQNKEEKEPNSQTQATTQHNETNKQTNSGSK